jgi:hypothetical protein
LGADRIHQFIKAYVVAAICAELKIFDNVIY